MCKLKKKWSVYVALIRFRNKLISVVYLHTIDHVHVNTPELILSLHELLLLEYYN